MNKIISHSKMYLGLLLLLILLLSFCGCEKKVVVHADAVKPVIITEPVKTDSDDPAIWLNHDDLSKSIILGTDKAGILFAFDLSGKIIKTIQDENMGRLNNVDIEYGMMLNGKKTDIAVVTDRNARKVYTYSMPDLKRIDNEGCIVFAGEDENRPMGIALYKRAVDGVMFAIVSRKGGPSGAYLWQYKLEDNGGGTIKFTKVREFGNFNGVDAEGNGEIEAIAVDDELGYVYYSDEIFGIRKYHADP
ncbi:MAG: phytase, partial [Calditrichia bacterium]|nr:phytase [Calditrichia bacterium]